MANKEHLAILKRGVEAWNTWREENPTIMPNLSEADFRGVNLRKAFFGVAILDKADFSKADLRGAYFRGTRLTETLFESANLSGADFKNNSFLYQANLKGANLTKAFLRGTDLRKASLSEMDLSGADLSGANLNEVALNGADLSTANLTGADLYEANLNEVNLFKAKLIEAYLHRANLSRANLSRANFYRADLSVATLSRANLNEANLTDVDLTFADFREADLSGADLTAAKALGSDFRGAILTGACIADWNTNDETILEDVFCKFVYRKFDFNKNQKAERCPYGRNFDSGEFTKVFQKLQDTIELSLHNGVNWAAFAYSFRELQVKHEDQPLEIIGINNRDGVIVVEVKVPPGADKEKAKGNFYEGYDFACKVLEGQCQAQLKSKDEQINQLFTIINQQFLIQKALAENPRTVVNNNLPNSQWAGGFSGTTHGNQIGGNIYNDGQQQDFSPESSQ